MLKKIIKKIIRYALSPFILKDYITFLKKSKQKRFSVKFKDFYPQIKDKTIETGFDTHYVYHTSWAARKLKQINPEFHVDISSSLYFTGIVSAFIPVKFYDYRPAKLKLNNLESHEGNLHHLIFEDNSLHSLSCMHTVEHIGLGRYGDPIDENGDLKAIKELQRVVMQDGSLLFVTPIGKPKIEFNAHRIYSYKQIISYFSDLTLQEFTFITDEGDIIENATEEMTIDQRYGCGCFWFKKI